MLNPGLRFYTIPPCEVDIHPNKKHPLRGQFCFLLYHLVVFSHPFEKYAVIKFGNHEPQHLQGKKSTTIFIEVSPPILGGSSQLL